MAPRHREEDTIPDGLPELLLQEHKWWEERLSRIDEQLTALRGETGAIRQVLASLPCEHHAADIAEAKAMAQRIERDYNLAKLAAGITTVVAMAVAAVSGVANNVASALGIGGTIQPR